MISISFRYLSIWVHNIIVLFREIVLLWSILALTRYSSCSLVQPTSQVKEIPNSAIIRSDTSRCFMLLPFCIAAGCFPEMDWWWRINIKRSTFALIGEPLEIYFITCLLTIYYVHVYFGCGGCSWLTLITSWMMHISFFD